MGQEKPSLSLSSGHDTRKALRVPMSNCAAENLAGAVPRGPLHPIPDMRPNITSDVSISTHVNQWWSTVPLVTASVIITCVTVYVISLLTGYDSFFQVCSSPDFYITKYQVYRALTSVVFHQGLLHLALNMMALYPISSSLERLGGSLRLAHAVLLFAIANAAIDTGISAVAKLVFGYDKLFYECAIGFSGVIFSLLVLENSLSPGSSRSIFGFFSVPAAWYPWVLLLIFQLLMPQASFIGHLSGILSGLAYKQGSFALATPSSAVFSSMERRPFMAPVVRRPGFMSGGSSLVSSAGGAGYSLPTSMSQLSPASTSNIGAALAQSWRSFQAHLSQLREHFAQRQQQQQQQNQQESSPYQMASFVGGGPTGAQHGTPHGLTTVPVPPPSQQTTSGAPQPPDPRFPGKGRTLAEPSPAAAASDPSEALRPQGSAAVAPSPAAAAALARTSGRTTSSTNSRTQSASSQPAGPDSTTLQGRPTATGHAAPHHLQGSAADSPALQQLLAMGFQKDAAQVALAASDGDVTTAVEILSTS